MRMAVQLYQAVVSGRSDPQPGLINALIGGDICGDGASDEEITGALVLLIGGGFDTTTALTAAQTATAALGSAYTAASARTSPV